ncbi:MAG: insulinase family protein [Gemmatimonadetes bacterium]|nr:insulinase family protein [Gemmatimonadota bacterium]
MHPHRAALAVALLAAAVSPLQAQRRKRAAAPPPVPAAAPRLNVPVEYFTLANGLRVVLSRDTTAPTVGVGVYYKVGFRTEPRDRTGFAHLFEHLMFQGSANLGKLQFVKLIENNGGILNGSTRFDFTNYYEVVPTHVLETILWAEADRMRGLAIDKANLDNQRDVVKNEVRVNVKNQPYGSFPWIDLPMIANTNWANAHDFYGDFKDLDAATLENATEFFHTFYAPNNAVLAVVGDFDPPQAHAWIDKYFGGIARAEAPTPPDVVEPRQAAERRHSRVDSLANRPALGLAWHVPPRWTPEWFAFGLIDQILAQGRDSRLVDKLVLQKSLTGDISAGINWGLGNQFNYEGPMLWELSMYHDTSTPADALLEVVDQEIEALRSHPVDAATLERAKTKMRSQLYGIADENFGLGKLDLLASFALFDGDPARVNALERNFDAVTPALILSTAKEWLRKDNRTVYTIVPGAKSPGGAP